MTTQSSSPTIQASWPGAAIITSPGPNSSSVPSSMRTRIRPLPRGQLTSRQTLVFAILVGGAGLWLLYRLVNPLTMWLTFATFCRFTSRITSPV